MLQLTINLYTFSELSEKAKEKAIEDARQFLLSIMHPTDFISGDPEYDTHEKLTEQYTAEHDYYCFNDEPILEYIEANDYIFYYNGDLCHTVTFCGQHPRAGEMDITIHGETFTIKGEN